MAKFPEPPPSPRPDIKPSPPPPTPQTPPYPRPPRSVPSTEEFMEVIRRRDAERAKEDRATMKLVFCACMVAVTLMSAMMIFTILIS